MFPSACSLRSTQCAALIALATAAGISRFEPVTPTATNATDPISSTKAELRTTVSASYFQFALKLLAPWLQSSSGEIRAEADAPPPLGTFTAVRAKDFRSSGPAGRFLPRRLERAVSAPSSRQHSFPYAAGPPAHGIASNPRADGTCVPCDSAARSISSVRIAAVSRVPGPFDARLARREFAGAILARPFLFPSFTPCGQPEATRRASARAGTTVAADAQLA